MIWSVMSPLINSVRYLVLRLYLTKKLT